ncbi:3-dehydroquinate synthase [Chitinispirillales bacterium ANBcel5]|uniref:3-dehydroquinate synthase n=1 Tax=Cellulosispirillum alkaliphilum TaxID=3039283 RepID=UPI002A58151A|nr:3-dehydroquinate synthase [Chitinispirillales bacterium ANBcel5]
MELSVSLGNRSYPVILGRENSHELPEYLLRNFSNRKSLVVTNTTLAELYNDLIEGWKEQLGCSVHIMPDGEKYKTIDTWSGILDTLITKRFDRSGYIIALGGGVVGDVAGFAAAAFMRGIDFVQVPTTLLAMVDSSVGGKTAVDHPSGKNLIGAFHQPRIVWIDTSFLTTLSKKEYVAGYAELFKYAFIGGANMFSFIKANKEKLLNAEPQTLSEGIRRSIEIKGGIVEQDETESGVRALLNFGHTFAHALEQFYGFEGLIHGEAVLWGIKCAVDLGTRKKSIRESDAKHYDCILSDLPMPALPYAADVDAIYNAMLSDKKIFRGNIRFILPSSPGESIIAKDVDETIVKDTLKSVLSV